MYVFLGLLILVLATFVIAYFAARTWHWGYVLVVVGIVLASAGYFVLAAETLRINSVLRDRYNQVERQLAQENALIDALSEGTDDSDLITEFRRRDLVLFRQLPDGAPSVPGISELEHLVRLEVQARGPVWRSVTPGQVDPQTGMVRVSVESPVPAGFAPDTIVYVFEGAQADQPDRQPQYLGEFRVTQASGQQADLEPALTMDDVQKERLAASRGPWEIYETMPADRHRVFSGIPEGELEWYDEAGPLMAQLFAPLSEEGLRRILPASSVEEYLRHGQPARNDDDDFRKAYYDQAGNRLPLDERDQAATILYDRRLRDYALELRDLTERWAVMLAERAGLEFDNRQLVEARDSAERLTTSRQEEIRKLEHDLDGLANRDLPAIAQLLGLVQQQVETIGTLLEQTLLENGRLAREQAAQQAALVEAIDRATAEAGGPLTSSE